VWFPLLALASLLLYFAIAVRVFGTIISSGKRHVTPNVWGALVGAGMFMTSYWAMFRLQASIMFERQALNLRDESAYRGTAVKILSYFFTRKQRETLGELRRRRGVDSGDSSGFLRP
jgi:hypothetical protein